MHRSSRSDRDAAGDTSAGRLARLERVRGHVGAAARASSYGYVLLLIAASFVFAATASDADWTASVLVLLQSATLVVALWTSGLSSAWAWHNVLFLLFAVALAATGLVHGGTGIAATLSLVSGLMTIAIVVVIVRSVISKGEVSRQSITGAVCVYLLLGMIFLFVYGVVATLGDGPFFAQGTDGTRALRVYFSYVTLATLGYGDYTLPATSDTRLRCSRRCSASSIW